MSQKRFYLTLFAMLMPVMSFAQQDSCAKVDYRADLGPIRDQGDTGWCFAYTAADMMTQKLRKSDPAKFANTQVSALDVTFQYFQNRTQVEVVPRSDSVYWKQKFLQREVDKLKIRDMDIAKNPVLDKFKGGFIDIAIHTYQDKELGVCTEQDLPSEKGMTKEVMNAVNEKYTARTLSCPGDANFNVANLIQLRNRCWADVIAEKCNRIPSGIKKWIRKTDSAVYQSTRNPDGSFHFYSDLPDGRTMDMSSQVQKELRTTIDQGLNHGSIVGVGMAPVFLMNDQVKAKMLKEHAQHEISIVARERSGNQCFYRLRNSWGTKCDMYNAKYKSRCKDGYIWVADAELLPFLNRAHYIE